VRHSEEVLAPVLLRGGDNEAIKAKEWEARRQVALVVSPAEATTSAASSLTSGGDHLSTDDSGHLCTGGLPATAAVSSHAERSSPPSSYGVRTRPSKNATATSAAYDVLYDPLGDVGAVCHGCGRPAHDATVTRPVDEWPCPAWQWQAALEAAPKPSKPGRQTRCS
jgi:hypothetical protein